MDWESFKGPLMTGALGLATFLVARHLFFRRSPEPKFEPKKLLPERDRNSPLAEAPVDVLRWEVQMHETARDLQAELDTKMRALQILMRDADEKIARLEKLQDSGDGSR